MYYISFNTLCLYICKHFKFLFAFIDRIEALTTKIQANLLMIQANERLAVLSTFTFCFIYCLHSINLPLTFCLILHILLNYVNI